MQPGGPDHLAANQQIVTEARGSGLLRRPRGVTMSQWSAVDRISHEAEDVEP